jgi:hypothetical protein
MTEETNVVEAESVEEVELPAVEIENAPDAE